MKKYYYVPRAIIKDFLERWVDVTAGYIVDIAKIREKKTIETYKDGMVTEKKVEYVVDFIEREEMQTNELASSVDEELLCESFEECKEYVDLMNEGIYKEMEHDLYFKYSIDELKEKVEAEQEIALNHINKDIEDNA